MVRDGRISRFYGYGATAKAVLTGTGQFDGRFFVRRASGLVGASFEIHAATSTPGRRPRKIGSIAYVAGRG